MNLFDKHRWGRLIRDIGAAWHLFRYDITIDEDFTKRVSTDNPPRYIGSMTEYRNYPRGRGFWLVNDGLMLKATDGKSEYWLNNSNHRWICMSGPDLNLPQNCNGDANEPIDAPPLDHTTL